MQTSESLDGAPVLVTGGTGLLGSHIVEQLRRRNVAVYALVRDGANIEFLRSVGAEILQGDITDPPSLRRACNNVSTVYHAAARVGDWGPWADFVRVSIDGTRNVIDACVAEGVSRLLHISSISVYGHVNGEGRVFDERMPLGQKVHRWSYYTRAKIEAENLVWKAFDARRLHVTVIRPSWMYGPRDRATLPRLIEKIRARKVKIIGDGENRLNLVHAGNVAEAAILAATSERAIGEAYNCCHDGAITQRQYFNTVAALIGHPAITRTVPYRVAHAAAFLMESFGHLFRTRRPPLVTRYALWLMGRRCFFECEKIKQQLGWRSSVGYEEGIRHAVREHLSASMRDHSRTLHIAGEPMSAPASTIARNPGQVVVASEHRQEVRP
jgi:nucleoside-diphosphate-sugar epimerase